MKWLDEKRKISHLSHVGSKFKAMFVCIYVQESRKDSLHKGKGALKREGVRESNWEK